MIKVIDNFLTKNTYNDLLAHIACGQFEDEVNPVDGGAFPFICKNIPSSVTNEMNEAFPGEFVEFLRASPEDVDCPNSVHHNLSMGSLSIMLYTSDVGGTAIMRHRHTGVMAASESKIITRVIRRQSNDIDAWKIMEIAEARPNRLVSFDSALLHVILPFSPKEREIVYFRCIT